MTEFKNKRRGSELLSSVIATISERKEHRLQKVDLQTQKILNNRSMNNLKYICNQVCNIVIRHFLI